jgi:hypothetical protein
MIVTPRLLFDSGRPLARRRRNDRWPRLCGARFNRPPTRETVAREHQRQRYKWRGRWHAQNYLDIGDEWLSEFVSIDDRNRQRDVELPARRRPQCERGHLIKEEPDAPQEHRPDGQRTLAQKDCFRAHGKDAKDP